MLFRTALKYYSLQISQLFLKRIEIFLLKSSTFFELKGGESFLEAMNLLLKTEFWTHGE